MLSLPIDDVIDEIVEAFEENRSVIIQAPPGAGKTTRVPIALLQSRRAPDARIVMLQPRRVAARAAARRIAAENNWRVGREIGYHVRFDRKYHETTRILVVTEGIFLAMLQADPFLESTDTVVFDEFHERTLDSDLCLAMCRRVRQDVRPDLGLVVMSATLDATPVADYLKPCRVVTSEGRLYPVVTSYLDHPVDGDPARAAADGVRRMIGKNDGDILVFLPGMAWIHRCYQQLEALAQQEDLELMRLHSSLSPEEQDRVLLPSDRTKIILATNIAETSLTIDGVRSVVDCGLARVLRFDRSRSMNRLETVRISHASADQRRGRAGRQGPGSCLRLWTEAENVGMRRQETAEINRLELSGAVLQLLSWGETNVRGFLWFENPSETAVDKAYELLELLGAIDEMGVTALGQSMARLPMAPRLARVLVEGARLGALSLVAMAAAVISEGRGGDFKDLEARVREAERYQNRGDLRFLMKVRDQFVNSADKHVLSSTRISRMSDREILGRSVLAGFPDRLARRRIDDPSRALMVKNQGLRLDAGGEFPGDDLIVAVEVMAPGRAQRSEASIRLAAAIAEEDLPQEYMKTAVELSFDRRGERVRAFKRRRWRGLLISEHEIAPANFDDSAALLAINAAENPVRALALDREAVVALLARLYCLKAWQPELEFPDSDAEIVKMLPLLSQGRSSFKELRALPLTEIILGSLNQKQRRALMSKAPEVLEVPSGSRIRLQYIRGEAPVLRVRIQELFGLSSTPAVGGGRIPVTLHLLAPNMRPQQITDDLASFWANTYSDVRAELRGRYPKHHWPEDPLSAKALKGTRRKG